MINVSDWLDEYDFLVSVEAEGSIMPINKERLDNMRLRLKAILWGKNLN